MENGAQVIRLKKLGFEPRADDVYLQVFNLLFLGLCYNVPLVLPGQCFGVRDYVSDCT